MGSFGLCDYLGSRGVATRIFNPALYSDSQGTTLLQEQLAAFRPTHIGLILHWQETVHGMFEALQTIRSWSSDVPVICGGFTAGYFGKDLLATCPEIDFIIQGDPEEPLRQLLEGASPPTIPNLIHRYQGVVTRNDECWFIDKTLLDHLSFAGLDSLVDAPLYLEKIKAKLGFPVFIGRGCVFNCEYCGGSRYAFTSHSNRSKAVARSITAVLKDLHQLRTLTDTLYICYENDISYITRLFEAIGADPLLKQHFRLNYGAWHLLDSEFLRLYGEAFQLGGPTKPVIEFSPEVYDDSSRRTIKRGITYTVNSLVENIDQITEMLAGKVLVDIFFSRYHGTEAKAPAVYGEIYNIFSLKHQLWQRFQRRVHVSYDHLSTDVGSRYWEQHVDLPLTFETLLSNKEQLDAQSLYPFPVDNLCFYIPDSISHEQQLEIEGFVQVLEQIEQQCSELFHILSACLATDWFDPLHPLINRLMAVNQSGFFTAPPLGAILQELGEQLADGPLGKDIPFIRDLIRFSIKKMQTRDQAPNWNKQAGESDYFSLNREKISVHEHDYPELTAFLHRLQNSDGKQLSYQRTVYLFLDTTILTLPQSAYRATLKLFEQPKRLDNYFATLSTQAAIDADQHRILIEQLIDSGVLLPSKPPV